MNDRESRGPAGAVDWRRMRLWEIQPLRDIMVIGGVVGLVYLGYVLSVVTVPMLLALALAYLVEPLVRWLTSGPRGRFISRQGAALGLVVLVGIAVVTPVTLGIGFAAVQATSVASRVVGNVAELNDAVKHPSPEKREELPGKAWQWMYDQLTTPIEPEAVATEDESLIDGLWKRRQLDEDIKQAVAAGVAWLGENAGQIAKNAVGRGAEAMGAAARTLTSIGFFVFSGLLTAFFFYFFCTGWGKVLAFWEQLIPERKKSRVIDILQQMDRVIAGFVRGRLMIALTLAGVLSVLYWMIGVPVPLILGPMVGLLFLVPYVSVVGVPVAIIAMLLQPSGVEWQTQWWWVIGAPIGVYMIGQVLDDWVLTPTIQGKTTDMATPAIVFASLAGGVLAGVYGLLLAIPAAACVKILLNEVFWPRIQAWAHGRARDALPIGRN